MPRTRLMVFDATAIPTVHNFRDLSGQAFGRLTVVSFAGLRRKRSYWNCKCDCGNVVTICGIDLKGHTTSCGCAQSEVTIARNVAGRTHGESNRNSPEYRSWCAMKTRCSNPKHHKYAAYGGRGISICPRWASSFESFLEDMGRRPSPKHTLDRWPNQNGDYGPDNCRWATPTEQNRNRTFGRKRNVRHD